MLDRIPDLMAYLERLGALHAGITPVLVLAELISDLYGIGAAKQRIAAELKVRPTVRGIYYSFFDVRPYLGNQWVGWANFTCTIVPPAKSIP